MIEQTSENKVGRPSKYKPEYCQAIIEYFDIEPHKEVVKKRFTRKDGEVIEEIGLRANDLRFFEDFAYKIGVNGDTLVEWSKTIPEFSASYLYAKHCQLRHLAVNGLQETFNSYFATFTAKNISNWRDKVDVTHEIGDQTLNKFAEMSAQQLQQKAYELANRRSIPSAN